MKANTYTVHVYGMLPTTEARMQGYARVEDRTNGGLFETWSFYGKTQAQAVDLVRSMKYQPGVTLIEIQPRPKAPFKTVFTNQTKGTN